ncbi:MAG: hypothetical protein HWE07_15350 [Cytophagia bacterium]|nr:hypothetical protein [Cytophagia bacterium]
MDFAERKIGIINWLLRVSDVETINKIESLQHESSEYPTELKGNSLEERLRLSEEDVKYGRLSSQDDVEDYFNRKIEG